MKSCTIEITPVSKGLFQTDEGLQVFAQEPSYVISLEIIDDDNDDDDEQRAFVRATPDIEEVENVVVDMLKTYAMLEIKNAGEDNE